MIATDAKAYVFLSKHGALIEELSNKSVILTFDGRIWVVTFLLYCEYLTKDLLNEIARHFEQQPGVVAYETGRKLREVCQRWLKDNERPIEETPKLRIWPTDLNYSQVALLLNLLVAAQENLERAAEGRKVQ